jgi:hypothetical protein
LQYDSCNDDQSIVPCRSCHVRWSVATKNTKQQQPGDTHNGSTEDSCNKTVAMETVVTIDRSLRSCRVPCAVMIAQSLWDFDVFTTVLCDVKIWVVLYKNLGSYKRN